ncbi:hypothetical protein CBM2634_U110012 [Cupriavidus taiwanensis]|uniref:Uncharacterized protein n=1 Tax=Cupriavidus taiwanensis TaxID=164546 RepID=A0A375JEQ7_9BURK|nr:hypothetical protein CBM2634_U110012 [Cupriavidus taiwanensis]
MMSYVRFGDVRGFFAERPRPHNIAEWGVVLGRKAVRRIRPGCLIMDLRNGSWQSDTMFAI